MSAGVSDQRMKGQGNQVSTSSNKNVETEERTNIPWSQQVDEASFECLASPIEGNQSGCYDSPTSGGTKFQYPPFHAKEGTSNWSSGAGKSSRRVSSSNNYDNDGVYGQQPSYNYFQKNGEYGGSWSSQMNHSHSQPPQQPRRTNNYDDYRSDRNSNQNDTYKSVQRGMENMRLETNNARSTNDTSTGNVSKTKTDTQVASVPKTITWASIASQPKPAQRTSSTSSILKKKGPGMPPPPMVPGKHNMDIGIWDSPKNGPALVPPPPPPVIPVPIMEHYPINPPKSNSGSSNVGQSSSKEDISPTPAQQKNMGTNNPPQNTNQNVAAPTNVNQNVRPPWKSQNNPPPNSKTIHSSSQNIRPGPNQGTSSSSSVGNQDSRGYNPSVQTQPQQQPPPPPPQYNRPPPVASPTLSNSSVNLPIPDEIKDKNNYNPKELDFETASVARFFVIKSFSEDDVHRSIKYGIWCSTERGNKRLDNAFRERESQRGVVYLFFSVNTSGYFCGVAQMLTPVDYNVVSSVWSTDMWRGMFKVKWIYVKDVPNTQLKHIRLENNDNKPVTKSRDVQEVPYAKGQQVLSIIHSFKHCTSIFDDFYHYEQIQELESSKRTDPPPPPRGGGDGNVSPPIKPHRGNGDYDRNQEKGFQSTSSAYRERNYNRGGYHNFDNRRNDENRGFDRMTRDKDQDSGPGHFNNNRENNGDFHNNRGFNRGDYNRRNNYSRDREPYHEGGNSHSGGFMSRGDRDNRGDNRGDNMRGGGGSFRDGGYNRDRDRERDNFSRGRGRGGGNGGGGGHRN